MTLIPAGPATPDRPDTDVDPERASFLVTAAGESPRAALSQAFALRVISAGLVVLGVAVMARTRPPGLSRARAAAGWALHARFAVR